MILSLSTVECPSASEIEEMPTTQLTMKRRRVVYESTLALIRERSSMLTGLVIPSEIPNVDYDFKYLIEHVRTEADQIVARLPIVVAVGSDEEYYAVCSDLDESWYRQLAVNVTVSPSEEDLAMEISPKAFEAFLRGAGSEPLSRSGRHDQANVWGAFALASVIREIDDASMDRQCLGAIEARLKEDIYYKKRLIKLGQSSRDQALVTQLVSARSRLKKLLKDVRAILIVEDQLEEGWACAYEGLFRVSDQAPDLVFTQDVDAAKKSVAAALDLIVLDVRLSIDRETVCQEEATADVSGLSGVKLASWLNRNVPTVPILAATASNKSWTLEALLQQGVNNYWVKAAPEATTTWDQCLANVLDLHKKLAEVLQWSLRTRSWVDDLYHVANIVGDDDRINGERLREKARSLHALLFSSFGPFRSEMAHGLQMNLAFLLAFSAINDLIGWLCEIEVDPATGAASWFVLCEGDRELVLLKEQVGEYEGKKEYSYQLYHGDKPGHRKDFPDVEVAIEVLNRLRLFDCARIFRKMKDIRNGLPLIHGKAAQEGTTSECVDIVHDQDISDLIGVLRTLAAVRRADSP